jgi:hypothetical protein
MAKLIVVALLLLSLCLRIEHISLGWGSYWTVRLAWPWQ